MNYNFNSDSLPVQNNTHVSGTSPQESSTRFHPQPEIRRPQKTLDRSGTPLIDAPLSIGQLGFPWRRPGAPLAGRDGVWTARIPRESGRGTSTWRWQPSLDNPCSRVDRGRRTRSALSGIRRVTFHPPPPPRGGHNAALISYGVPAARDTDATRPRSPGNEI